MRRLPNIHPNRLRELSRLRVAAAAELGVGFRRRLAKGG